MEEKMNLTPFRIWKIFISIKRTYRTQKRQFFVFLLSMTLAATSAYWILGRHDPLKYPDLWSTNEIMQRHLQEMMVKENGSGCVMPDLNPFSDEAMQFTRDVDKIVCTGEDWVECYKSECQATEHILSQMKNLVCTYRDIIFLTDMENTIGQPVTVHGAQKYQLNRSDHVKISCTNGVGLLASRWYGYKVGFRPVPRPPPPRPDSLNVMILMMDSVSRNGFLRRMPKTYKVLVEELNAVVMKSHNIVMDATPGALFPILTGHMELELPDSRRTLTNHKLVDETLFIFNLLKNHGYRTAFFEDMPWIGTFQYRFNGFRNPPTDHYLRSFFIEESKNGLKWWSGLNNRYCVGTKPLHCFMLNATSQFFELDGKKFCLNFIVGLSHEDFNMITAADEDLVEFLRGFSKQHGNDTVLIVMGDHGPRFSSIRSTYQGKIEERLPFVSLVLPEHLKKTRPEALKNLIANSEVLTTHYDMHATLLDILNLSRHRNKYQVRGSGVERGLSLLKPIAKSRSCSEAGVMPHWCACAAWRPLPAWQPLYGRATHALATYIDDVTAHVRSQCAIRALTSTLWVLQHSPNEGMLGFKGRREVDRYIGKYERAKHVRADVEYLQTKIVMDPGHAVFEGTMKYIVKDEIFVIKEQDISRINSYANESKCVSETSPNLNKFCYCTEDKNKN